MISTGRLDVLLLTRKLYTDVDLCSLLEVVYDKESCNCDACNCPYDNTGIGKFVECVHCELLSMGLK